MGRRLRRGQGKVKALNDLFIVLFGVVIILCFIVSFRLINIQSVIMLLIFNALFISLSFQLNGAFNVKLCLLASGNVIGFCWNFIFYSFATKGTLFFGKTFGILYTVFSPFLCSIWIVAFWSLSLTVLHREGTK